MQEAREGAIMNASITFTDQGDDYPYIMVELDDGNYVAIYPKAIVVQSHRPITVTQNNSTRVTITDKHPGDVLGE